LGVLDSIARYFGHGSAEPIGDPAVPADHPLRPVLDERYLAMRDAMARHDADGIRALLTEDFTSIDVSDRRQSGETMIRGVLALQLDRSKRTAQTTVTALDVRADGREAVVEQRYAMTTTGLSLTVPRALQTWSTDVWRDENGTWRLAQTRTNRIESQGVLGRVSRRRR
jgi:ketosteroid isomerase-like protein